MTKDEWKVAISTVILLSRNVRGEIAVPWQACADQAEHIVDRFMPDAPGHEPCIECRSLPEVIDVTNPDGAQFYARCHAGCHTISGRSQEEALMYWDQWMKEARDDASSG